MGASSFGVIVVAAEELRGSWVLGFKSLGFRGLGFRGLGFKSLGFRV